MFFLKIFDEISNFSTSHKSINIDKKMRILVSPSLNQRVRYQNECRKTLRFISVPKNKILTIEVNIFVVVCFYYVNFK